MRRFIRWGRQVFKAGLQPDPQKVRVKPLWHPPQLYQEVVGRPAIGRIRIYGDPKRFQCIHLPSRSACSCSWRKPRKGFQPPTRARGVAPVLLFELFDPLAVVLGPPADAHHTTPRAGIVGLQTHGVHVAGHLEELSQQQSMSWSHGGPFERKTVEEYLEERPFIGCCCCGVIVGLRAFPKETHRVFMRICY